MNVAVEWLHSGKVASLDGIELVPVPYPHLASMPISLVRGQARAYVLADGQKRAWILKKFAPGRDPEMAYVLAIRGLVPHEGGFESGTQRRVLTAAAIGDGFDAPEFIQWVEKTILMPRVRGIDWLELADSLHDGTTTASEHSRGTMCRSLVTRVRALESAGISHRDLSITNVFIDPATWDVHLIDWDALYHPSLTVPSITTVGTPGYTAPFIMTVAGADAGRTWCRHADRFAMAILCAEFLLLGPRSALVHDGGLFEQYDLNERDGPTLRPVLRELTSRYPAIGRLVDRALMAETFDACPSPEEWLAAPPLAKPIHAPPPPDRQSVMTRFESYMRKLKEPRPPIPPAPPLPETDFSAVIRSILAPRPLDADKEREKEER